jgi:hypothetical protein
MSTSLGHQPGQLLGGVLVASVGQGVQPVQVPALAEQPAGALADPADLIKQAVADKSRPSSSASSSLPGSSGAGQPAARSSPQRGIHPVQVPRRP